MAVLICQIQLGTNDTDFKVKVWDKSGTYREVLRHDGKVSTFSLEDIQICLGDILPPFVWNDSLPCSYLRFLKTGFHWIPEHKSS